jgi:AraC-like DNA-binding protein
MSHPQKAEGFTGQQIVVLPRSVVHNALHQNDLSGLLATDVGFFPNATGHLRERVIGVDQAIFIYCTDGSGWCELSGERHVVGPGDLLVIPPEASHAYGADPRKPWSIYWVHVAGSSLKTMLPELAISADRPVVRIGQDPELGSLFGEIIDVLEHGYTQAHLVYSSRVLSHLLGLMIWRRQQEWHGARPRQSMAQSIAYMKRHLRQRLRVSQLAAVANLSPPHFNVLFKRHTGYSPMDYFIRLRMHEACRLLDHTDLSVKQIAAALGYDDPFYFSRIFKALNDIAPSEYRMLHKG